MVSRELLYERCGRVEISAKDFEKFKLEIGDTVIARAIGSKDQLGKASFFGGLNEAVVIDSHVMRFRPDPTKCNGLSVLLIDFVLTGAESSFSRQAVQLPFSSTSTQSRPHLF